MRNNRKILVFSFLVLLSALLAYLANYAMVHRLKAMVLSGLAIVYSLSCFLRACWSRSGWEKRDRFQVEMFFGPVLYAMHSIGSPVFLLILYLLRNRLANWIQDKERKKFNTPFFRFIELLPSLLFLSLAFLLTDTIREYGVWHVWTFRLFPSLIFLMLLILAIALRILKVKGKEMQDEGSIER
ncbi:MAG: hypothetical protein JNL88_05980 [Bacteroidia bacterium]|nr:hypothetical protein [Bacteroidia bacterium]